MISRSAALSRRAFLGASAALTVTAWPLGARASDAPVMTAAPASAHLLGVAKPATAVWAYDASVPGPTVSLGLGDVLDLTVKNALGEPTTVHWHGLRAPNEMDGVPWVSQAPIQPGESFRYLFGARNAGTFWYHPHYRTSSQLDRGLHGVVIVADETALAVDRDVVWVLDDWRLDARAAIAEDFGDLHDASHRGRLGNTATVNGVVPGAFAVRAGERIRLRLVNTANAWIFGLDFAGHDPVIVACDGHAVRPHRAPRGLVVVGPAQRVDLVLDMHGAPGESFEVVDRYLPGRPYTLLDVVYSPRRLRSALPGPVPALAPADLPEPDPDRAERHEVRFAGGAMGGLREARFRGDSTGIRELARAGKVWAVNGVVADGPADEPLLRLRRGRSHVIDFVNDTAFPHPVHLHGHSMRLLSLEGAAPPVPVWRDTVLMPARSRASVALVADNPGLWMLHCHIPEHQEAGMMALVRVE